MLEELRRTAAETLKGEGVAEAEHEVFYQIDIRYRGQGMKLTINMTPEEFARDGIKGVEQRFDAEHEQLFTFALDAEHELVGLRTVVQGAEKSFTPSIARAAARTPRRRARRRPGSTPTANGAKHGSMTARS